MTWSVVIPTIGRPSLRATLASLAAQQGPLPERTVVVDDRRDPAAPLDVGDTHLPGLRTARSGGRGPAAARNAGWHAAASPWVCFVDDDVELPPDWSARLAADLDVPPDVAGVQGRLVVPLPGHRRPTDWERATAGLTGAAWATADMAYRRDALCRVGGFDERFPRAFREDADLALRVLDAGYGLVRGSREARHPVRPTGWATSVRVQAGNADDVLMRRLHGRDWHQRADAPVGRRPAHLAITALGVAAVGVAASGAARRPPAALRRRIAAALAAGWLAGTAELAWARVAPGPRTPGEVARMAVTSVLIPPAATLHWLRGHWVHRRVRRLPPPDAVLFDRDGTLVHDAPYNGDPQLVKPVDGAAEAVERLRSAGVRVGVVTNQSGVARGLLRPEQVEQVNRQVDALLGPFDTWQVCPHDDAADCGCRKPRPGLVRAAAGDLGTVPARCVVVGDSGRDVAAALAAGARAILVPTEVTRPEEVREAPVVAVDLASAVDLVLGGRA